MEDKTYLTKNGFDKLKKELEYLKKIKKPQLSKEIGIAREMGDLKENAEYIAAKETLGHVMGKIIQLESKLSTAKIIDKDKISNDKVCIGLTVLIKDVETKEELEYTLVGTDEVDFAQGKISINSPIADALLGKKIGDIVEFKAPAGIFKYKVLKISK
ncbi:transcription elongation factor GreA [bacterium]|nr:transcription elongation factor GreA [bacterium]